MPNHCQKRWEGVLLVLVLGFYGASLSFMLCKTCAASCMGVKTSKVGSRDHTHEFPSHFGMCAGLPRNKTRSRKHRVLHPCSRICKLPPPLLPSFLILACVYAQEFPQNKKLCDNEKPPRPFPHPLFLFWDYMGSWVSRSVHHFQFSLLSAPPPLIIVPLGGQGFLVEKSFLGVDASSKEGAF